jgi:hypothetical protein
MEQAESDRLRTLAEIQAREDRARALAAEQEQAKQAQIARMGQQGQRNAMRVGGGQSLMGGGGREAAPLSPVQMAQQEAELKRLEALGGQAPQKMTNLTSGWNGMTLDPNSMNAYQRQAFLPQRS